MKVSLLFSIVVVNVSIIFLSFLCLCVLNPIFFLSTIHPFFYLYLFIYLSIHFFVYVFIYSSTYSLMFLKCVILFCFLIDSHDSSSSYSFAHSASCFFAFSPHFSLFFLFFFSDKDESRTLFKEKLSKDCYIFI